MIVLISVVTLIYCGLILLFIIGFDRIELFETKNTVPQNSFSIVIPFRDEEGALPDLLESLKQLNYPSDKYEIIFIDDDSKDNSIEIIKKGLDTKSVKTDSTQPDIIVLNNNRKTNSPKKDAINTAIDNAKFDWILTTDADCILSINWLKTFDAFIQERQPKMIVAPVTYTTCNSFFERFQLLDFLSLQGVTIGGYGIKKPFLCNGANLCYSKTAFNEINGFEGNTNIASGDDIFLLEKIVKKHPEKVFYLKSKEAIVTTKPQPTIKQLLNQRIRWASKSTASKNSFNKFVGASVLSMNILLIVLFLLTTVDAFKWQYLLSIFALKFVIDFLLLHRTTRFFKQIHILPNYILSSFIYPVFTMFVVITSLTSSYNWKGREFKK